jgi:hypothetical protein
VAQAEQATPAAPQTPSEIEALKAEIASLKATLQAPPTTPAVPEKPVEPPPTPRELAELDETINGYSQSYWKADNEIKLADANRAQWANQLRALNKALVRSFNDPAVDTAKLVNDISAAEEAVAQYDRFLESKAQERSSYLRDYRTHTVLRENTERLLRLSESYERATQAENERQMSSEASNWRTSKWEPAKKAAAAKIPEGLRGRFDAYVERLGKAHVHSRGEDGRFTNSISDPTAFVNGLVEDFLAVAREGAQSYTVQKVAEIPASPVNGKAAAPALPTNKAPQTQAEFDALMDQQWDSVSL